MSTTRRRFLGALGTLGIFGPAGIDAAVKWQGKLRVMEGPMLGAVYPDRATVWARVGGEHEVQLEVIGEDGRARRGEPERSAAGHDHCVVLRSPPLEPDTRYRYRILIDGREDDYLKDLPPLYLRSAPEGPARFSVAFGSCAQYRDDPVQAVWAGVEAVNPALFLWLGDNVYIDSTHESVMAECYRRQRNVLSAVPVLRKIPQLATWDDHDYCLNDQDRRNPAKEQALAVFRRYWANPAYGEPGNPGTYFRYHYGGVDFFFLDVRYYRAPNDAPDDGSKTMLGPVQLEWLKAGLRASKAPFKVLASGSGWSAAKGPSGDAWSSHLAERNRIFDFLVEEGIGGVILLSGDTHVGELNCIPWSERGGYDLYELVSSPLAQLPEKGAWTALRPEMRIRQVYARSNNFGLLEFDLAADDPTVTLTLRDTTGREVWWRPVTLKASELVNGTTSWRTHIDEISLRRYESWKAGGEYYLPEGF
ncbi:MAG TPA: alkaline phosphatase D family protein [Woeseiaceae bacterium]|nr:alkaline phosphatase D family protein [Woeseiaceae bacterium]